jgi:ribose/xylose/arabinose/galactoside ABC-type transport system permease subunit
MLYIIVIVYAIFWFFLKYTQYGRNVYSAGGSSVAAYLSGINVKRVQMFTFVISSACCGLASYLYVCQGRIALNSAGTGSEMDIMAGVILGGISFAGGSGSVVNSLLGILLLGVIANGMGLLGITPYYQMMIKGIVLLVAVLLEILRKKRAAMFG